MPGGGIEPDESAEDAIVREFLEETGCQVKIKRKIADYLPVNRMTQKTYFFECQTIGGELTVGNETKEIQFFSIDNLPRALAPPYKGWILDAQAGHPSVLCKKIEGVSYWMFLYLLICHPILVTRFLLTKIGIHINR